MKRILIIIVSSVLVFSVSAFAEVMTNEAEGIVLTYGIGFGGSTTDMKSADDLIKLYDLKGQPVIGRNRHEGVKRWWGAGYHLWVGERPGDWVPLTISRQGNDIRIDFPPGSNPRIYWLSSNNVGGHFSNNPNLWAYLDPTDYLGGGHPVFDFDTYGAGYFLFKSQIAQPDGPNVYREAYFRGLTAGTDPAALNPDGYTYISSAGAVGRVDLSLAEGITVVSYPFDTGTTGLDLEYVFDTNVLMLGSKFDADLVMHKVDPMGWTLPSAFINATGDWKDYDDPSSVPTFKIHSNNGYYVWRRYPGTATVTMIGKVPSEANYIFVHDAIAKPITIFGMGIPVLTEFISSGLQPNTGDKFSADLVMHKVFADQWILKSVYKDNGGVWRDYDTQTNALEFRPELPNGYYYWNRGANDITWQRNLD